MRSFFNMCSLIQSTRPAQYSLPINMTGNASTLFVCTRVIASKNSSIVPKPPGKTRNAFAYFKNMTLREKKYLKSISFVINLFGFWTTGTCIFSPTERPPASLAPLLAASIMPGPAPVMIAKPFLHKSLVVFSANL